MISILGNQLITESYSGYDIEEVALENSQRYERDNGMYLAIQESYSDIVGIYEAIAITDMKELQQRQTEGTLMEATVVMEGFKERAKAIYEKIKAWLQNLWTKIKAFFKKLYTILSSLFMSGKDFVEKNKKALTALGSKKVTLKNTYKYSVKSVGSPNFDAIGLGNIENLYKDFVEGAAKCEDNEGKITNQAEVDRLKEKLDHEKNEKENSLDKLRGGLLEEGPKTEQEFANAIEAKLQDGKLAPGDVTYTVTEAMDLLTADFIKSAKSAETAANNMLAKVGELNKKFESKASTIKNGTIMGIATAYVTHLTSYASSAVNIVSTSISKQRSAIKAANANAKKVCVMALTGRVDK
jgi:hypothetical protein